MAGTVGDLSSPHGLVALYSALSPALRDAAYGPDTAVVVTRLAVNTVPGVQQASISEGRGGRFRTLASTGEIATAGDLIQYELASGPCVDAIIDDVVFRTGDIARDSRWPEFGTRAHAETGTTSMMSLRLFMHGDTRTVGLNLYSTERDAFDDDAQIIATVLATHAAAVLVAAAALERVDNLERALASNRRIGMAIGVLMSSIKLTEDNAFALLRIASQDSNRKLADVAEDVITTGALQLPTPATTTTRRPSEPARARRPNGPPDPA